MVTFEWLNRQNSRLWIVGNPYAMHESPKHPLNIVASCALLECEFYVHWLFFEEAINMEHYQNLLTEFTSLLENPQRDYYFQ
jgi:hypothetical protein